MTEGEDVSAEAATAYWDAVNQPYKLVKETLTVRDLELGWGCSSREERASMVVLDSNMVPWLLERFQSFLKGFAPLDHDSETARFLKAWTTTCGPRSPRHTRLEALTEAVKSVVQDILTRHPQCHRLPQADKLPHCMHSRVYPEWESQRYKLYGMWLGQHIRWDQRGELNPYCRLTIEAVNEAKGSVVRIDVVSLPDDFADHHLDRVAELCKEGRSIPWGKDLPADASERLLPLLAYHFSDNVVKWLLITTHPKTMLFKLTPATRTEDSFLTCSNIISEDSNHLSLSVLASICLAELRTDGKPLLYPEMSSIVPPDLPETAESVTVAWTKEEIAIDDLQSRDIVLGFAPLGDEDVEERYPLQRQSEPDLDPLVVPLPACPSDDKPSKEAPAKTPSTALIVATERIGDGTCGIVYLASYGRHRVAVKISRELDEEGDSVRNEYGIYCAIRRAGLEGRVSPRCFGLFVYKDLTVLITAYSGNCLEGWTFRNMDAKIRFAIYAVAKQLGEAGIQQNSFSPRNVVCDDNGMYRVIDFHRGEIDKSEASAFVDEYLDQLGLEKAHITPLPATDDKDLAEDYDPGKN